MSLRVPVVALVGRPNVGKSTIFNRLVRKRLALVDDSPGVTRDRLFSDFLIDGRKLRLIDTGGIDIDGEDVITKGIRLQAQLAIDEADVVLLVVDAAVGVSPGDHEVAQILRRAGKLTAAIANKIDDDVHVDRVHEVYELGVDPVFPFSAEHGRGVGALEDWLIQKLDPPTVEEVEHNQAPIPVRDQEPDEGVSSQIEWNGGPIRVAVVGRPNAGKSSLVNHLLGEERMLASEVAGTTRDSIDCEVVHDNQSYVFVDTAGIRRKRSVADRVERFAVMAAVRSLESADVVVLILDGTLVPSDQDAKVAALAHERGKGLVILANKWDLVENDEWKERFEDGVRHEINFASYARVLKISAKTGRGMPAVYEAIIEAQRERHRRVSTAELNRFYREVVEAHPPPVSRGRRPKLYFGSQPLVRPPTFIFAVSAPDDLHDSYQRYLANQLRDRYGFRGTPIWLKFRKGRGKTARRAPT